MTPTDEDLQAYRDRMALYQTLGQSPEQIATSLNNYFGKPFFTTSTAGLTGSVDIQYVVGSANEISFMATIGNIPLKDPK